LDHTAQQLEEQLEVAGALGGVGSGGQLNIAGGTGSKGGLNQVVQANQSGPGGNSYLGAGGLGK
jgi:hypothetical protein